MSKRHDASEPPNGREPCEQLWHRFKDLASQLKDQCASRANCYIGIDDRAASVVFQVERVDAPQNTAALTVSPEMDAETVRLVFHVRAAIVIEGSVTALPIEKLPVSYDARLDHYQIDTTPEVAEEHMAAFFLRRAALLNALSATECRFPQGWIM